MMEYDIHTFLDLLTLGATCWVEYMMRVPLKSTYSDELDTIETHHVVRGRSHTYPHNWSPSCVACGELPALLPLIHVCHGSWTDVALPGAGAVCASGNDA